MMTIECEAKNLRTTKRNSRFRNEDWREIGSSGGEN